MFDRAGNAAREWESFGRQEPYFGVLADDRFHRGRLDDDALGEFFDSGRRQVASMIALAEAHRGGPLAVGRALDFGCGVGRLLVALGERADKAVGVDVSPSMLDEARRNCRARGLEHVEFVQADELGRLTPEFDLITSHIVFQHIPSVAGYEILGMLVDLLAPGGVGVMHFTLSPASWLVVGFYGVLRTIPPARRIWNLVRRRPAEFPFMEMNAYRLERLLEVLHAHAVTDVSVRFEPARRRADHAQVTLTFTRSAPAPD